MPIGPLMIEHRLIERMIAVMKTALERFEKENTLDLPLLDIAIDFFRNYADRCHHGKEEHILFRDLKTKHMEPDHKRILDELIEEHQFARETTAKIVDAKKRIFHETAQATEKIAGYLKQLIEFYPKHIEKEDKRFFIPIMKYFSKKEQDALLEEEYEFDKNFIHVLYRELIAKVEN